MIFKDPHILSSDITPRTVFEDRRTWLKTAAMGSMALGLGSWLEREAFAKTPIAKEKLAAKFNEQYSTKETATSYEEATTYNNFYEFGGGKNIWLKAQKLPTNPWMVEVGGLVKNPQTYDIDTIKKTFSLEERIYRFRCVEAWSMVLPWLGFPMGALIAAVEPKPEAKFVRFTSFYDPEITKGPGLHLGALPWPYTEGLRIEEMANELAFFAVGIFGHDLPKQQGAPLRMVIPWKYGFKGAKSIVKIEFTAKQPATYWNTIDAHEYDFEANVNPSKPHPRWSQATEKFIGSRSDLSWEIIETLPYNGYGEYVASLYS